MPGTPCRAVGIAEFWAVASPNSREPLQSWAKCDITSARGHPPDTVVGMSRTDTSTTQQTPSTLDRPILVSNLVAAAVFLAVLALLSGSAARIGDI